MHWHTLRVWAPWNPLPQNSQNLSLSQSLKTKRSTDSTAESHRNTRNTHPFQPLLTVLHRKPTHQECTVFLCTFSLRQSQMPSLPKVLQICHLSHFDSILFWLCSLLYYSHRVCYSLLYYSLKSAHVYVCFGQACEHLDGKHTIFGQVEAPCGTVLTAGQLSILFIFFTSF